jgi:PiT family inorganic phosphate transporter
MPTYQYSTNRAPKQEFERGKLLADTDLILVAAVIVAFYVAAHLGANDVANSFATSVGSGAIPLVGALAIAGGMEFLGAVLLGGRVSQTLAFEVILPEGLLSTQMFVAGMFSVMVACGLWLQIATSFSLPVASSHAVVGALTGFAWVAVGPQAVQWWRLGIISLSWLLVPVASALVAAALYAICQYGILTHPAPQNQWREWLPWLSALLCGILGWLGWSNASAARSRSVWYGELFAGMGGQVPSHDWYLLLWGIATVGVSWWNWSVENHGRGSIEAKFARLQILSASLVAFAHGSNDVGNAIAPLAAIAGLLHPQPPTATDGNVPIWILLLGGSGIVVGLAIWGQRVIATVGSEIIALQPSSGFCAEIGTAITVLLASQAGLPVSTSHALVGGVVGIALVPASQSFSYRPLRRIAGAWLGTVPAAMGLSAITFRVLKYAFL